MQENQPSTSWRKPTLCAQISPKSQATECKFPRRLRWSRRRRARRLSPAISKRNYETPALRKSKYWQFTSMAASKENKLPPSFSGFKSQKLLHESGGDGVSGTDSDKQVKQLSSVFHLWPFEAFSSFQNSSIVLINAVPTSITKMHKLKGQTRLRGRTNTGRVTVVMDKTD